MLMLGLVLGGCSSVPVPVKHRAQEQHTLRAVQHWNALAVEVSAEVAKAMDDLMYSEVVKKPIHVARHGGTAFGSFFHDLMETALVRRGLQVSREVEADTIFFDFDVRSVEHSGRYASLLGPVDAGLPAGIGAVAVALVANPYDSRSENEVLVVTSMWYGNRFIHKSATAFYIHDPDWRLYRGAQPQGAPNPKGIVGVRVKDAPQPAPATD